MASIGRSWWRFFAATEIGLADVPCLIRDDWTDVDALEASYAENAQRLDPDPLTQYETFARLISLGQTPARIADAFSMPELNVKRRLAIANLCPAIRTLIRAGNVADQEIQTLTLATKKQQREWAKLAKQGKAPRYGHTFAAG